MAIERIETVSSEQLEIAIVNNNVTHKEAATIKVDSAYIGKTKLGWKRYGGIILSMISSVSYSLLMLAVKMMDGYHPLNKTLWRYMGILVPAIPLAIYYRCVKKTNIFSTTWPLRERENMINFVGTHIRGIILFTMVLTSFWGLKYLTVADLAVISYSGPVFVMILAFLFLGEQCGVMPVLVTLMTLSGVVVILRPPILTGEKAFSTDTLIGVGLGIASMVCFAVLVTLVRRTRKVHFTYMLLASGVWGVTESSIATWAFGVFQLPQGHTDILLGFVVIPAMSFISQGAMMMALKFESAGPVTLLRACDVIFAFIWQAVFFDKRPDIFSYVGATIILTGVMILTLRKWISTLPQESGTRKRFRLLLR